MVEMLAQGIEWGRLPREERGKKEEGWSEVPLGVGEELWGAPQWLQVGPAAAGALRTVCPPGSKVTEASFRPLTGWVRGGVKAPHDTVNI